MDQGGDSVEATTVFSSIAEPDEESPVRRVIEASPTALVLVGPSGLIELANGQAERMFDYEHDEMLNLPLESLLPEGLRSVHVGLRNAFLNGSSTRQMGAGRELFGRRKDGSAFPLEIGLNPLSLDGRSLVLAGIIDMTAHKLAEAENQRQRLHLERSNAELEEFAHVASHDLKAPLRALGHLAEWITEDVAATASQETLDNLRILRGRVVRLQMLLDGLLVYARVSHGQKPAEDVDLDELVGDITALLAPPKGFSVVCDGVLGHLRTHRTPIRRVLENLISNAIKHHDRPQARIEIAMRLADGIAEFRVTDDGPGIEPRFHARIFVIFQTLVSRDDVESSGIGLAIVKKNVEGHGGTVCVESAPPTRGASFVFTWRETAL